MPLFAPYVAKLYAAVTGRDLSTFIFADAPLSTIPAVTACVTTYILLFFTGRALSEKFESRRAALSDAKTSTEQLKGLKPLSNDSATWSSSLNELSNNNSTKKTSCMLSERPCVGNAAKTNFITRNELCNSLLDRCIAPLFYSRDARPRTLRKPFLVHNMLLSAISYVLLHAMLEQVLPMLLEHGFFYAICHQRAQFAALDILYYVTYLTKFYEFIDTAFLVLKGKKVDFLHWYHHSMTALLCFSQLYGHASVQWVPISLNLLVHVVMYFYYALSSLGVRVWWKKYITVLQIAQFVIDVVVCFYCLVVHTIGINDIERAVRRILLENQGASAPSFTIKESVVDALARVTLPFVGARCQGEFHLAFFGCAVLSSYLFLFLVFYRKTYKAREQTNASKSKQDSESKDFKTTTKTNTNTNTDNTDSADTKNTVVIEKVNNNTAYSSAVSSANTAGGAVKRAKF